MLRELWRVWLEEWRFARRCLPWPVQACFLGLSAAFGLGLGVALAFAVAVAVATLGGCTTGHTRVRVGLDVPILEVPLLSAVNYEHLDAETARAGARLPDGGGLSWVLAGPEGPGGGL